MNTLSGIEVVYDWIFTTPLILIVPERSKLDYGAIDRADVVVAFYPYGYGTSSEMGYAIGFVVDKCFYDTVKERLLPLGKLVEYR